MCPKWTSGFQQRLVGARSSIRAEFIVIFIVLPALFAWWGTERASFIIPALWIVTLYCWRVLKKVAVAPTLITEPQACLVRVLLRFAMLGAVLGVIVWQATPQLLFKLPRENPGLWLLIMILYPLLSVFPQEYIYREYFFARSVTVLPANPVMLIILNALLFAMAHLIFGNWQALALTFAGGLMFAFTYRRSQSLLLTCLEHSLWGCLIFTVGLGEYFVGSTVKQLLAN